MPLACDPLQGVGCDKTTGTAEACDACLDGSWGATCGETCSTPASCTPDADVTCAQGTGAALTCSACEPNSWGAACDTSCAMPPTCDDSEDVVCDQITGDTESCGACDAGSWGAACDTSCALPSGCAGDATVTCDQVTGEASACTVCLPGAHGATCERLWSVSVSPEPAFTTTALSCAAAPIDPSDPGIAFTYAWEVEGASAGSGATLSSDAFERDDTVTCTATPAGGTPNTATVVIANTPPVLTSVTVSPDPAFTTSDLACSASVTDADGDMVSLSYAWTVDGTAAGADAPTLSSSAFAKDQTVRCTVTPTDGTDTGAALSSDLLISNTPPTAPATELTIDPPSAGVDDLGCFVSSPSSDADGDALTYEVEWLEDGAVVASETLTPPTLSATPIPASQLDAGVTWTCRVRAWDGEAFSGSVEVSTTVTSPAPSSGTTALCDLNWRSPENGICGVPGDEDTSYFMDFDAGEKVPPFDGSADLSKGHVDCCSWNVWNGAQQVLTTSARSSFSSVVCGPADGRSYTSNPISYFDPNNNVVCLRTASGAYVKYIGNQSCCGNISITWERF